MSLGVMRLRVIKSARRQVSARTKFQILSSKFQWVIATVQDLELGIWSLELTLSFKGLSLRKVVIRIRPKFRRHRFHMPISEGDVGFFAVSDRQRVADV